MHKNAKTTKGTLHVGHEFQLYNRVQRNRMVTINSFHVRSKQYFIDKNLLLTLRYRPQRTKGIVDTLSF